MSRRPAAYYNEIDPYAAAWLRNLIAAGLIAPGEVDERSIVDVRPADLAGFAQCHFFAGIGGWSCALRLAGWPDDRPVWTGSCPCQPFSVAGQGKGQADERHLWPVFARLIGERRPPVVFGEQVAAAVGKDWLDGVCADLEGFGYACGAAVVPACAVGAPHRRDRLWFVADADSKRAELRELEQRAAIRAEEGRRDSLGRHSPGGPVADADGDGSRSRADDPAARHGHSAAADDRPIALAHPASAGWGQAGRNAAGDPAAHRAGPGDWNGDGSPAYVTGADGKARRVKPGLRLLAHGVPARVGRLRAYGNAIVPQVAAEFIGAYLDVRSAA